jgi:cysteinyl-tRNA synthetase
MYKFLDYTDYAINDIREIRVYREAMSDENTDKVLVKTYKLDENLRKEFDNDFNSAEALNETEVKVSEKVAEKWINISENKENEKKVAEESKKTAQMLVEDSKKAEWQKKFDAAKDDDLINSGYGYMIKKKDYHLAQKYGYDGIELIN